MHKFLCIALFVATGLLISTSLRAQNSCGDRDRDGDGVKCRVGGVIVDCNDDPTPCDSVNCDPIGGPYVYFCECGQTRGYLTHGQFGPIPAAAEICDGADNDCDNSIDEGLAIDADNDGVLACGTCGAPAAPNCDCEDSLPAVKPGASEICDALDNDCNGETDAISGTTLKRSCYTGPSGTAGVGTCVAGTQVCDASTPGVESWGACTGEVTPANPPADPETTCDNRDDDCDGTPDDGLTVDADSDGVQKCGTCNAPAAGSCDCDDTRGDVKPGLLEQCDHVDHNCDASYNFGVADRICFEGTFVTAATYNGDCPNHLASCAPRGECVAGSQSCQANGTWGTCGGALVLPANDPSQQEALCDGRDEDCDGVVDENLAPDGDSDGWPACGGACGLTLPNCDCNDGNPNINPGHAEICDALDNNCDGEVDAISGTTLSQTCYSGPSGTQGVGTCVAGTQSCNASTPGVASWNTCTGEVTPANPPAQNESTCDGLDDDCDGTADDGLTVDGDTDGYLACGTCDAPAPYACDCADGDGNVHPGRSDPCDGINNDCDAYTDERNAAGDPQRQVCFDGPVGTYAGNCPGHRWSCRPYGECARGFQICTSGSYSGVACGGQVLPASQFDQNESDNWATSPCDGLDNDCDDSVDDGYDGDGDGVGRCDSNGSPGDGCTTYLGASNCDCDDSDPNNYPGNAEVCDGFDNNCDGIADEMFDVDGDGYLDCDFCAMTPCDCDDGDNSTYPGAPEQCDCVDHSCDGNPTEGFADNDGDGVPACAGPSVECNDGSAAQRGAWCGRQAHLEVCDALDNDCDASTDENLSRSCYTGPSGTLGIGTCVAGTRVCDASTPGIESWSTCSGEVVPSNPPADPESTCDGQDEDCDGTADDGFDGDNDGVTSCAGDCNDGDPNIHPGLPEQCDNVDHDCDGSNNNGVTDRLCFEGANVTPATYAGDCPGHQASCQPRGVCAAGSQSCQTDGTWSACGGGMVLPAHDPALDEVLCDNRDEDCDGSVDDGNFDADGDGALSCAACAFLSAASCDCDDSRNDIKPGGVEICDGADNDCNGSTDDDGAGGVLQRPCYSGQPSSTEDVGLCHGGHKLCESGAFSPTCVGEITPASDDACDGFDNNCDGVADEGHDVDGDGVTTCGGDCDDTDPDIYTGNLEICDGKDNDCDGDTDGVSTPCYEGPSGTRGVGLCAAGTAECRGGVPIGTCAGQVLPVAEVCDDQDNDCDGDVDEDFDRDRDGLRDCAACPFLPADACDCDDGDPYNNRGFVEICDCRDNNCDGVVDEGGACEGGACHDLDQDGYRNCDGDCNDHDARVGPGFAEIFGNNVDDDCDGAVDEDVDEDQDGVSIGQGDCDDRFAEIYPGAIEVCDGFDNNCDGQVDEGFDVDGDFVTTCGGDCDDGDPLRSPLFKEVCGDNIDNDCDGIADANTDIDGDGVTVCDGDCNDHNATVHPAFGDVPAAAEVCDGQDNDCNGRTDEGFDVDGDRWFSCLGDCDDNNPEVNPAHLEVPQNGLDDDCDGATDEGEFDLDGDGFSPNCGDCNDADRAINPHSMEICDRVDNNCDGYVDARLGEFNICDTCFDADGDGFTNCQGDCNDSEPSVYPGATEVCDELDNDCDHSVDLDPQGFSLCNIEDGGAEDSATVSDVGARGGDTGIVLVVDGGADAGPSKAQGILKLGCACNANRASPDALWTGLGLLLLAGLWRRRRGLARAPRPRHRIWLPLLLLGGCGSQVTVPGVVEIPDAAPPLDASTQDARSHDRRSGWDATGRDVELGDLTLTRCPVSDVLAQIEDRVPGTELPFASPPAMTRLSLNGVDALALDDAADEVLGFVLRLPLSNAISPSNDHYASTLADQELTVLDNLTSSPRVAGRIEQHKRVFVDIWGRAGVSSLQRLEFAGPLTAYAVRQSLLVALGHFPPGAVQGLPATPSTAQVSTTHIVQTLYLLTPQGVVVVVAVTTEDHAARNQMLMADLTNGSHVGMVGYSLRYECEIKTLPDLKTDFIWVIDNSASMQEEQQALSRAAGAFFEALTNSGLDFRLGVTTTDGEVLRGGGFTRDATTFADNVRVGINGNGREMGLEFGLRTIATSRASDDPLRQIRNDAALIVIFFSDEDSSNLRPLPEYVRAYQEAGTIVYGIVGPRPWGCQRVGLGVARPGDSYIEVAERSGGATGSICNPNLAETITAILVGAAGAASRSPLVRLPVSNSLAVRVHRDTGITSSPRSRQDGFDFEPSSNTVLFFGDANSLPPAGSTFEVAYQYFSHPEG